MSEVPQKSIFERAKDLARDFVISRQQAYVQVFNQENQFSRRVLKDLQKFCRADKSTFNADPRVHAVLEGRREVWLRIQENLNLDTETLWKLYGGKEV